MNIFLTSQASEVMDKVVTMLPKKPEELKLAFIPTAADPYGDDTPWTDADRVMFRKFGFQVEDFDLKNKTEDETRMFLSNFGAIFVEGGNTFYLLEKARKSGFDKVVKEMVAAGKIYIGCSAGSILAGPDIESVKMFDEPEEGQLENTSGFGIVDFVVIPHFGKEGYDTYHDKLLKEYGNKYNVITITDQQFIVSDGKQFKVVNK